MGRRRGEGTLGEKAAVGHSLGTQGRWSCQKRWAGLGICISQFCLLRFRPPVLHGMQQGQRNPWLQRALGSQAGVRQMREELGPASLPSEPWGWRRHGTSSLAPFPCGCLPTVLWGKHGCVSRHPRESLYGSSSCLGLPPICVLSVSFGAPSWQVPGSTG